MGIIYESELKVLTILWDEGSIRAKDLTEKLNASTGWQQSTAYTVIKKCINKGLVERCEDDPSICRALITRKEAQAREVKVLVDKMFGGVTSLLLNWLQDEEGEIYDD